MVGRSATILQKCRACCVGHARQLWHQLCANFLGAVQLDKVRKIIAAEGYNALWRGVRARIYFHVPAAAVCWGTYESLKTFLLSP